MQAESVARLGCLCAAKIRLGSGSVPSETASAVSDDVEQHEEAWIDLMKLGSVFSHEGSNLYLRLWQLGQSVSSRSALLLSGRRTNSQPIQPVAPPGFCNRGEVRYGSIGGLEYEVPQSRLYCLCINVALCSTAL